MTLDMAKHKNLCLKILKEIFSDSTIAPYVAFKGGTAAFLCYGLTRFSVDLDFDLLNPSKEEYIFERVKAILEKYGTLKDVKNKRYSLLYQLSYDGKEELAENIKVEIDKRNFGARYHVKDHLGISLKVMVQEDMAAHKLVAMLNRIGKANRDIYDVWYFLSNDWPVNKEMVEKMTKLPYKDFLKKSIDALSTMSKQRILHGIRIILTPKQKM